MAKTTEEKKMKSNQEIPENAYANLAKSLRDLAERERETRKMYFKFSYVARQLGAEGLHNSLFSAADKSGLNADELDSRAEDINPL